MLFIVWGFVFMFAVVPGLIIGWVVGKLPIATEWCSAILIASVAALSIILANKYYSLSLETFAIFFVPIVLPTLLGLWVSRTA